jgi:ribosomal protein S18 acetylase RimI-like enzyme
MKGYKVIKISGVDENDDLTSIIRLIYETDDYIYPTMCGSDYRLFEEIMKKLLFTDSIFSYRNIIAANENGKTLGLLLYFGKGCKLPQAVDKYLKISEEQQADFDYVIHNYFTLVLSKIDEGCLYINNLCVDKENRRHGIAANLIDHLTHINPDKKIILDCLEENTAAINLYIKLGYKITDHFLGFAGKQEGQINCIKLEYNPTI